MSRDSPTVYVYPTEEQYDRWNNRMNEVGETSESQFVCDMVEAGIKADKGFSQTVSPDESLHELRQQRNDLKDELEHARDRIQQLEQQLHQGERETIERFVENNPGSTYDDIVRHLIDTIPERVNQHLDQMEGVTLSRDAESGQFYPFERSAGEDEQ